MIESGETLITSAMNAKVTSRIDTSDNTILVNIEGQWFTAGDIKELRKFLKKRQKHLEGDQPVVVDKSPWDGSAGL